MPLPGTDPLLSLCQLIAPLPLSSITLSNCAITVALLVCAVVTVYPAQLPAWKHALHALHSCDFTRCVRQTAKVRVRQAPSDASGGVVAAADQRPAKKRLGEVEPGVFTIQGIVGHELMEDALQAQLLVLLFLLEFLLSKSIGSLIIICWHLRVLFAWLVATI